MLARFQLLACSLLSSSILRASGHRSSSLASMAASSVLSSREMVKKWAQVSLVAHPNEQRDEVGRLAEALSSFIRAEAQRLVVGAKGAPLLCSHSNDGNPYSGGG